MATTFLFLLSIFFGLSSTFTQTTNATSKVRSPSVTFANASNLYYQSPIATVHPEFSLTAITALHETALKEMEKWKQLNLYLSNLNSSLDFNTHYKFPKKFDSTQITTIEKLFYTILSNEKIISEADRLNVVSLLFKLLFPDELLTHDEMIPTIKTMMNIFYQRTRPIDFDGQFRACYNSLHRMFLYGAKEMRKSGEKYNRYTMFALYHMKWIINTNFWSH